MKMKYVIIAFIILSSLICLRATTPQEEKKIKEYVNVVNIELLMRIIKDGEPLGGFKKNDFKLFENGKEQKLNGFFEVRRRMVPPADKAGVAQARPGRLFLLIFWLNRPGAEIKAQLDNFFSKVYRPGDRVLLSSPVQVFDLWDPREKDDILKKFQDHWQVTMKSFESEFRGLGRRFSLAADEAFRIIESYGNKISAGELNQALNELAKECSAQLKEWQLRFQRVHFGKMETMARDLEGINADKWALVFYEQDNLPLLDIDSVGARIDEVTSYEFRNLVGDWVNKYRMVEMEFIRGEGTKDVYQKLRSLFIQSGTVFHFLGLSADNTPLANSFQLDPFIKVNPISSNWDGVFQSTSQITGGKIVNIDEGVSALDAVFNREDIYYVLTYVPDTANAKKRKIELKMTRPEQKGLEKNLVYGRRLEMEDTPTLSIQQIKASHQELYLELENFYTVATPQGPYGHFSITLAGQDEQGNTPDVLYQDEKESLGPITIPLNLPKSGKWQLIVRVTDLMSGRQTMGKTSLIVPEMVDKALEPNIKVTAPDKELSLLLIKAAAYADKLKRVAIRFTCQEEITQSLRSTGSEQFARTLWKHDYQIVLHDGGLDETRLLLKKNRKVLKEPLSVQLETRYKSNYSFFLPVTLLAVEKQAQYIYSLKGQEKLNKRKTARILVSPLSPNSELPAGEVWVDMSDGSVLQIKLDPTTLIGFKEWYDQAKNHGIHLILSDTHQYFERYQGLQFPSSTTITENQTRSKKRNDLPFYLENDIQFDTCRVYYEYTNYRFFKIDMKEKVLNQDGE